ncbi:membrane protein [Mycobacterium intracellulare subsp. chimaera]|uniref:Membrane protein n=1 Tax=Mycobacterium intracellulare subsp. chimaera TaxID=222805 RepID=A0A7U5MQY9_MYCIT|nr:membrane protein [Mycobacterium intracellulare subsp. chimaera]
MTPSYPWGDDRGQPARQLRLPYHTLRRRRERRLCHSFARVGVRTAPERLRAMLEGAPLAAHEMINLNFALIAIRLDRESRAARYKRLRQRGARSLMFAGLVMVVLNFLVCMAYLLLNLAEPTAPL